MISVFACVLLVVTTPTAELAPPPHSVAEDAFNRWLKGRKVERNVPTSPSSYEEARKRHLYTIAMMRRMTLEQIDLFEKAQGWTNVPERKEKFRKVVEDLKARLPEYDELERQCQDAGPPLPKVVLPTRP